MAPRPGELAKAVESVLLRPVATVQDLDAACDEALAGHVALLALTEGDNRNLMCAQIAQKIFGLKQVIAKVNDPVRAHTLAMKARLLSDELVKQR